MPAKLLKVMVGPCGLEPQTSTVSKLRDYVFTITYKAQRAVLVRASTAKTGFLQVKNSNSHGIHNIGEKLHRRLLFEHGYSG
jgi:hypothetical protein